MNILSVKRCIIGESPVWNEKENRLYFTNGYGGNEICAYDFLSKKTIVRKLFFSVAAIAFDNNNRIIVSHKNGVHYLNDDNSLSPLYDEETYQIKYANDMKVGPDGAIYVGTQSEKRKGVSNLINGKLFRISTKGKVDVILDNLLISNGMDWSIDESKFYHTDSDTHFVKEYTFNKSTGEITYTGRQVFVRGVDGFTIGYDNNLYVACWGQGHIAVVDTTKMQISKLISLPYNSPTSCGFVGAKMDTLAITSASLNADLSLEKNAGFTILLKTGSFGRKPYLYKNNVYFIPTLIKERTEKTTL